MTTDSSPRRALIVLTSHAELGDTGRATGYYLPEVAHPWRVFTEAGMPVDLVSVRGGEPPVDGVDLSDPAQQAFLDDPVVATALANTPKPDEIDAADYAVVFYAGGHGTMWDFPGNRELAELARQVYENGGVVAAVCHGPAGLVDVTLSDGSYLVAGKRVAAFTDDEEAAVGLADVVPFLLASRLVERGAEHVPAPNFRAQVVTDGRLVTGQNPASATPTAEAVVSVLRELAAAEPVLVTLDLRARSEETLQMLARTLPFTRLYAGCREVATYVDDDDPRHILLVQRWDSRGDQEAYIDWRESTGDLAALLDTLEEPPAARIWRSTPA